MELSGFEDTDRPAFSPPTPTVLLCFDGGGPVGSPGKNIDIIVTDQVATGYSRIQ